MRERSIESALGQRGRYPRAGISYPANARTRGVAGVRGHEGRLPHLRTAKRATWRQTSDRGRT